jgi:Zn-dependent peptidase ImmA (M78 family)
MDDAGDLYTYENYNGLKSALNYYRHQKFISIIGNEKKRPRKYELTSLGYLHSRSPMVRRNYRRARTEKEANKIAESILMDDVRFIEAVKNYVENNVQEADIGDKKTNQIEHSNEDVRIVEKPVLIPSCSRPESSH